MDSNNEIGHYRVCLFIIFPSLLCNTSGRKLALRYLLSFGVYTYLLFTDILIQLFCSKYDRHSLLVFPKNEFDKNASPFFLANFIDHLSQTPIIDSLSRCARGQLSYSMKIIK